MIENESSNFDLIILVLSSILSFITGWGLSVLREKQKHKQMISQSFQSMISELEETKKELEEIKLPLIGFDQSEGSSYDIKFSFGHVTIASYESMLFSGVLREINVKTQRKIIDLYEHIKQYNSMKDKIQELVMVSTGTVKPAFIKNLKSFSESTEQVLEKNKRKIDEVLEILKSE